MHYPINYTLLLSFLFTLSNAKSQDVLVPEWSLIESSSLTNGNSEAWAIGTDADGNLYWGVNADSPGLFEYMNAHLYKMDSDNNLIWMDTVATGGYAQQSYNLKVTDSLVFLGGRTCNNIGVTSCNALFKAVDANTGITTDLNFIWDGGYGYEEIDGIHLESDGIYLTGWTEGDSTAVDLLLMKIDYNGNILWENSWGSSGARDDHQDGHIVVDDSMVYVSGLWDGTTLLGWEGSALLAKFDKSNGNFVDSVLYGRNDIWLNAENALGMTTDGDYLYTVGYTTTSENNWDLFVAKYDKNFNQIWYTTWGGTAAAESSRSLVVHDDGSIYVGGTTESYGSGEMDVLLLKLDDQGTPLWYKTWGGIYDDQILDTYLHDNSLYLTGKTASSHPSQKWEALLLKVDLSTSSILELPTSPVQTSLYPNPTSSNAILKFENTNHERFDLAIYDAFGQKVRELNDFSGSQVEIETGSLSSGIYTVQLLKQGSLSSIDKLIVLE